MTLRTSSNKINPATGMFKLNFKRSIGITVLIIIGFLLICPAYMLIDMSQNLAVSDKAEIKNYISGWIYAFSFWSACFAAVSVTALNLLNFSFMYKRPSSDLIDSLPLTRTELFFSKTLSSLLLSLIPVLLSMGALAGISVYFGYFSFLLDILVNLAYILIAALTASAFSMLFIVCSANVFDFLISFVGVNAGILVAGAIICVIFDELLIGYSGTGYANVLAQISPPFYMFSRMYSFAESETYTSISPHFFIRSGIYLLIFTVLSLILYKKRKTENSGNAFAYKFMYVICSFVISFCGAFGFGMMFSTGKFLSSLFFIFAVIGAAICSVIYGAITYRGFKTVKTSLIIGAVSVIVLIGIVVAVIFDVTGFNKKIPEKSDIQSVAVTIGGETVNYKNPDTVLDLHKKIIDDNENALSTNIGYFEGYDGEDVTFVDITYSLKNGKVLKRAYEVFTDKARTDIDKILKSDERFDGMVNSLKKSHSKTLDLYIYGDDTESLSCYMTRDEALKLIEIYKNEIQTGDYSAIRNKDSMQLDLNWYIGNYRYEYITLLYDDNFTDTMEYIESLKLNERAENYERAEDCVEKCD